MSLSFEIKSNQNNKPIKGVVKAYSPFIDYFFPENNVTRRKQALWYLKEAQNSPAIKSPAIPGVSWNISVTKIGIIWYEKEECTLKKKLKILWNCPVYNSLIWNKSLLKKVSISLFSNYIKAI